MSDNGSIIPISDEQAKLGQELVKAFSGLGLFVKEVLGSVPSDLIGYLGGDWLRSRRIENIAELMHKTKERLDASGVKDHEPVSLTVALPILRGAADESREELRDLWARLLAASMDPLKASSVRQKFTEVITKMDPLDSLVLRRCNEFNSSNWNTKADELGITRDQLQVSMSNLNELKMVVSERIDNIHLTSLGIEFLRIVMSD